MSDLLLQCRDVTKTYRRGGGVFAAVDGVNLELRRGEVTGLLGRSGCGKTTLCRMIGGLIRPDGGDIVKAPELARRGALGYAFQHPHRSLNPRRTVLASVREPLDAFSPRLSRRERDRRALEALEALGVPPSAALRLPGEISGGQAQRAALARAMVTGPELLLLDEPVSALDAPAQSAVLNCLKDLCDGGVAALFVAHDPAAAAFLCRTVAVMYAGRVVERGSAEEVLNRPRHPYTRYLLDNMPPYGSFDAPASAKAPSREEGCAFAPLCPHADGRCRGKVPHLEGDGTACLRPEVMR